jgi:undecaprenyl-phosphate 4-deoxy-4-formamido-L-arabinose transferase
MLFTKISIVVPVFNSQKSLEELVSRIYSHLSSENLSHEIFLIDDGSSDDSWAEIVRLKALYSNLQGLRLARNFGQHNALLAGIRAATGEVIVTLDDDLQNPPEEIAKLLKRLNDNCDVVYGLPEVINHSFLRRISSFAVKTTLKKIMGAHSADIVGPFRAFKFRLVNGFTEYKNPSVNIDVLLSWSTTKFSYVNVEHDKRKHGESNYSLARLLNHAINMLVGYSSLPLKISGFIGVLVALIGFLIMLYVLTNYFMHGTSVPGFVFTISIISIFAGAQLIVLGIIGEYLARSYDRSIEKPQYIIQAAA